MARDDRPNQEIRFTQALEAAGLSDWHDRLRPLAQPVFMLSETEADLRPAIPSLSRAVVDQTCRPAWIGHRIRPGCISTSSCRSI